MVFQGAKTVTIRLIFRMIPSEILSKLNFRVDFWIQNSQFIFSQYYSNAVNGG